MGRVTVVYVGCHSHDDSVVVEVELESVPWEESSIGLVQNHHGVVLLSVEIVHQDDDDGEDVDVLQDHHVAELGGEVVVVVTTVETVVAGRVHIGNLLVSLVAALEVDLTVVGSVSLAVE